MKWSSLFEDVYDSLRPLDVGLCRHNLGSCCYPDLYRRLTLDLGHPANHTPEGRAETRRLAKKYIPEFHKRYG
jgi:hypothetical protein